MEGREEIVWIEVKVDIFLNSMFCAAEHGNDRVEWLNVDLAGKFVFLYLARVNNVFTTRQLWVLARWMRPGASMRGCVCLRVCVRLSF